MRAFTSAIQTIFAALQLPMMSVIVSIPDLSLHLTNLPRSVTVDGQVYTGAKAGAEQWTLVAKGLGENLKFEGTSAVLEINSLLGAMQTRMINDNFRGVNVTISVIYMSGLTAIASGWATTWRCDVDTGDEDQVTIRLASSDATTGEEYPRNTNQDYACPYTLSLGYCTFRWSSALPGVAVKCDHGYDTPNGCKIHHPDIIDPLTLLTIPQSKPFGGRISHIDEGLLLVGGA